MKKFLIIAGIIVAVGAIILITKICISQKGNEKETIQKNDNGYTTHDGTISLEIVSPEEEPKNEKRSYAPGEIKKMFEKDGNTYLTLDMLTINKDFNPGVNDFFINNSTKTRDIAISKKAKAFDCGAGPDNNETSPDVSVSIETVLAYIQQWLTNTTNGPLTYYFDIDDGKITTIYQQCLP